MDQQTPYISDELAAWLESYTDRDARYTPRHDISEIMFSQGQLDVVDWLLGIYKDQKEPEDVSSA